MKTSQEYRKQNVKSRTVDFQLKNADLYEYSKTFNFTAFVMEALRKKKDGEEYGV